MGVLMVRCPNTGREISTGRSIDQSSFDHSPVFFGRTACPICQTEHEWFAKEAWIEESLGSAASTSEAWRLGSSATLVLTAQRRPQHREADIGEGMGPAARTIVRLNIEHFRTLLKTETDLTKRKMIEKLLAEEEIKLAELELYESDGDG